MFLGQHKNGERPPNFLFLFLRIFRAGRTYLLSASFITAESQHHEESHLVYRPLSLSSYTKGSQLNRCYNSTTYRNTLRSPPTFAMSTATLNFPLTFSYFIPGDLHASPLQQPGPRIYGWTFIPLFKNQQLNICLDNSDAYSAQTFSCFILSQFNNYFLIPARLAA